MLDKADDIAKRCRECWTVLPEGRSVGFCSPACKDAYCSAVFGEEAVRLCRECGAGPTGDGEVFCTRTCATAFNGRRRLRAGMLYDLFMANAYELSNPARKSGTMRHRLSALTLQWREEDHRERQGRYSWHPSGARQLPNVRAIRAAYKRGEPVKSICAEHDLSVATFYKIVTPSRTGGPRSTRNASIKEG